MRPKWNHCSQILLDSLMNNWLKQNDVTRLSLLHLLFICRVSTVPFRVFPSVHFPSLYLKNQRFTQLLLPLIRFWIYSYYHVCVFGKAVIQLVQILYPTYFIQQELKFSQIYQSWNNVNNFSIHPAIYNHANSCMKVLFSTKQKIEVISFKLDIWSIRQIWILTRWWR